MPIRARHSGRSKTAAISPAQLGQLVFLQRKPYTKEIKEAWSSFHKVSTMFKITANLKEWSITMLAFSCSLLSVQGQERSCWMLGWFIFNFVVWVFLGMLGFSEPVHTCLEKQTREAHMTQEERMTVGCFGCCCFLKLGCLSQSRC